MTLDISVQASIGEFQLDASFVVPAKGVTAIFGPSGSGKTSLLRAIAGLIEVDSAQIQLMGDIWHSDEACLPVHQRSVGFVFQQPSLFEHLNVHENLKYGLERRAVESRRIGFDEVVSLLDIDQLLDRQPQFLSGGEVQRVAIGRALLASPMLLLMDEPLASLDTQLKREILPYLDRLQRNLDIPVLYVSHSLEEVVRLADQLILMDDGKVLEHGPLMQVLENNRQLNELADEPFTLLEGKVIEPCTAHHLTEVDVGDLLICMPGMEVLADQKVRLRLYAKDISLSLSKAEASSILNIFESAIESIEDTVHPSQKLVRLIAGQANLVARVSSLSCEKLDLKIGDSVFAQIKAASLIQ
jgi:molybdate transport system ATP-binding protein